MDSDILEWIEQRIWLVSLYPRKSSYDVLADTCINEESVRVLSAASDACWSAILEKDAEGWGRASISSFDAQLKMFPNMAPVDVLETLESYKSQVLGWKLSGAGGGGYLVFVSEKPVKNAIQIRIRRDNKE